MSLLTISDEVRNLRHNSVTSGNRESYNMRTFQSLLKPLVPPLLWNITRAALKQTPKKTKESAKPRIFQEYLDRNRKVPPDSIVLRDGMQFKIHPESRYSMEHFCYISEEMTDEMDSFLRQTNDCYRLLDIGALHGVFSLAFANHNPKKSALAVDASPIAFSKLLYNSFSNPKCQITTVECALSDQNGQLAMTYDWEHLVACFNTKAEKTTSVPMQTGDQLCNDKNFEPDCIKIDVEGHEIEVLIGLKHTITSFQPLIFLEIHPMRISDSGHELSEIVNILTQYNYSAENIWGRAIELKEIENEKLDFRIVLRPRT